MPFGSFNQKSTEPKEVVHKEPTESKSKFVISKEQWQMVIDQLQSLTMKQSQIPYQDILSLCQKYRCKYKRWNKAGNTEPDHEMVMRIEAWIRGN